MTTQVTISLAASVTSVDFYPYAYTPTDTVLLPKKAVRAVLTAGVGTAVFDDTFAAATPGWRAVENKSGGTGVGKIRQVSIPSAVTTAYSALPELGSQSLSPPVSDGTKQPLDADLTALAAAGSAADRVPYYTGTGFAALATLTSYARTLLAAADATAAKTLLSITTGQPARVVLAVSAGAGVIDMSQAGGADLLVNVLTNWGAGTKAFSLSNTAQAVDGQRVMIRFKDAGTSRTMTFTSGSNGTFREIGAKWPTASIPNQVMVAECVWNAGDNRMDLLAFYPIASTGGLLAASPDNSLSKQTVNNSDAWTGASN